MNPQRIFFVAGATKAGTNWLYECLAAHPQVHLRTIKELHFFDSDDPPRRAAEIVRHRARRADLARRPAAAPAARVPELSRQLRDREDWIATLERGGEADYLRYLADGAAGRIVGDVTPAYGLLDVATLRRMGRLSEDVRAIYLLRDPVARLWSHVRMIARRRGGTAAEANRRAGAILRRVIAGRESEIARRSDYAEALRKLEAAFAPGALLVALYEDMFRRDGLGRICRFLGIGEIDPSADRIVHGGVPIAMSDDEERMARDWLAPQYDEIARRMGALPPGWRDNMARV